MAQWPLYLRDSPDIHVVLEPCGDWGTYDVIAEGELQESHLICHHQSKKEKDGANRALGIHVLKASWLKYEVS